MDRVLYSNGKHPDSVSSHKEGLKHVWGAVREEYCRNLIRCMPMCFIKTNAVQVTIVVPYSMFIMQNEHIRVRNIRN